MIYLYFSLPLGTILFLIPCLMPTRWLLYYGLIVAACLVVFWYDSLNDPEIGLGMLVAFAFATSAVTGASLGSIARLLIAALRARGVRRRYAWLPAPVLFIGVVFSPSIWGAGYFF